AQRILAATIVGRIDLDDAQQKACTELAAVAGPLEIGALLDAFGADATPATLDRLADSLATAPGRFSLESASVKTLFGDLPTAQPLIEELEAAETGRGQRLDELAAAIAGHQGDAERGKAAFTKATCAVCHKAKGEGGVIGPELTTIGAIRSERDLLEAIAFPSATYAREYEPFVVTLKDGSVKLGRIGEDAEESLELIDAQGVATRIPAAQIASREMAPVSLMPPGLERMLGDAELADLVAYLRSLK
ncbi:MAG: c-type cytochrome, partial [Rhizobiales bacterium]|nr:c-type cytochrome [Hyphomicrobiales bacterium]